MGTSSRSATAPRPSERPPARAWLGWEDRRALSPASKGGREGGREEGKEGGGGGVPTRGWDGRTGEPAVPPLREGGREGGGEEGGIE
jgi:hypothetical protein